MVLPTSGSPFLLLPAFAAKRPLLPPNFDHSAGGSKRPSYPTAEPVPRESDDRKTQTHVHQYSRGARSVRCPSARFSSQNRRTHPPSHRWYQCIHGFQTQRPGQNRWCALPGFVDSKNEEKTERNAGYLVVSQSGGGMLRQGTRKGIRRTPANRGMRAHRIVKSLDISEDVCHGLCP